MSHYIYNLYRSTVNGQWSSTPIYQGAISQFTDTGLQAGVTYYYKLEAVDNLGNVSNPTVVSFTTPTSDVPTTPVLTAEVDPENNDTVINLFWTESTTGNGQTPAVQYVLEKETSFENWTAIFTGSGLSYSDSGLSPNSTYYYRIRALGQNSIYSLYSTASETTSFPIDTTDTFIIPSNVGDWNAGIAQPNTQGINKVPNNSDTIILSAGTSTTSPVSGTRGPLTIRNLNGNEGLRLKIVPPPSGITIRKSNISSGDSVLTIINSRYFDIDGYNTFNPFDEFNTGIRVMYAINATTSSPDNPEAFIKIVGGTEPSEEYSIKNVRIDGGYSLSNSLATGGTGILANDPSLLRSSFSGRFVENISFDNVRIYGTAANGIQVGNLFENNNLPVRDCTISNVYAEFVGQQAIALYGAWEGDNKIHNCTLLDCGNDLSPSLPLGARSSITVWEGQCKIYNNVIRNSGEHGIRVISEVGPLQGVSPGTGYSSYINFLSEIYNNVIVRSGSLPTNLASRAIRYFIQPGVIKFVPKIYNNTCLNNERGITVVADCIDGFFNNNIFLNNSISIESTSVTQNNNLITGDLNALFINTLLDDYRLTAAQPAVGTVGIDISSSDILGVARSAPDIGAYEFITAEDITPPTVPVATATLTGVRQITLTWTASTDLGSGVASYSVQRSRSGPEGPWGAPTDGLTNTTLVESSLNEGSTYYYQVRAVDNAGNISAWSATTSESVPTSTDTTPPTDPSNLRATANSSSQITLTWTESSDTSGIASYSVQRSTTSTTGPWTSVGTGITATTFTNTGLTASTTYYYQVRAVDNAGNVSNWSTTAQATTLSATVDTTPPSAPTLSLATFPPSGTNIDLSWTASTDNVAVSKYSLERSLNGSTWVFRTETNSSTRTFTDSGLNSSTTYYYRVKAVDSSNNSSAYSNVISATTGAVSEVRDGVIAPGTFDTPTPYDSTIFRKHSGCEDITVITGSITESVNGVSDTITPRAGGKFLRSRLNRLQPCDANKNLTYRAESQFNWPKADPNITWFNNPNTTARRDWAKGVEYWWSISTYIHKNWNLNYQSGYDTGIIWQLHDRAFNDPAQQVDKNAFTWRRNLWLTVTHESTGLRLRTHTWGIPGGEGYVATASISGTTMTVTAISQFIVDNKTYKGWPMPLKTVTGTGIAAGTQIVRGITYDPKTGLGTFELNKAHNLSSRTIKGGVPWAQPGFFETWNGVDKTKDSAGLVSTYKGVDVGPEVSGLTWNNVRGKWIDWCVHFKLSGASSPNDKNGFRKIWVNRRLVFEDVGQNNWGEQPEGQYTQFGIYNWGWRKEHITNWTGPDERIMYHDELRCGNSNSNFRSMHPDFLDPLP